MSSSNVINHNASALEEEGKRLLDFNQRLDINLLDNVVKAMYNGDSTQQKVAQSLLTQLKENPDAWTKVDTILSFSKNQETKYFALQILENLIQTRWNALPASQTSGIKSFIVDLIIQTSSDTNNLQRDKFYLTKLNMVLVQILKREWPKRWPTFIGDIVGASKSNESLCQNNMNILKLLTEEVFDFSSGQLTQAKTKYLKDTMCGEFSKIFQLCTHVMETSENPSLVLSTLDTLLPFLSWIPDNYVFETQLINTLIMKFLPVPAFRNITLQCLTEIAAINNTNYEDLFLKMFTAVMDQLNIMLPKQSYIKDAYAEGTDAEQKFIQNLSMFLCTFLKERGALLERNPQNHRLLSSALNYLLMISEVEEIEVFKICLEYWNSLVNNLYNRRLSASNIVSDSEFAVYAKVLSTLRYVMIDRMAKPEEVLVVENDQGEAVRVHFVDTDSITLYNTMRETLVYLTHLDPSDTERIMSTKLHNQTNDTEWSWKALNTLCWAIGSISGAMNEDEERAFIVNVIKELLGLCEKKRGKDNKAIIAANIMYVVGQYPRFLRAHWKFLKTVVNKLFEFMHETHEGVQDMACDTFIKIAQKCRRHFVTLQPNETAPFIDEIFRNTEATIYHLQPQQVHTFFEAVGCMIASQDSDIQERLIPTYMALPNSVWDEIVSQAQKNLDILKNQDAVNQLANILKTNSRACKSLGHTYVVQLKVIYLDMLNLYKVMSLNITGAISTNGDAVTRQPLIKAMRVVKKEILKLISLWISVSENNNLVMTSFLPHLLETVLVDYKNCPVPAAREPEVLTTMSAVVEKLNKSFIPFAPNVFEAVFQCTLEMISQDIQECPEYRVSFYNFLHQVVKHCFPAILALTPPQFKLVLDSIIWAMKHTMRNVADLGYQTLLTLLENISINDDAMQNFYQNHCLNILQHLFSVVTDPSLTAGLKQQTTVLAFIFCIIQTDKIRVTLSPTQGNIPNHIFVEQYVKDLLKSVYPHLTDPQIEMTVRGFFHLDQDIPAFGEHLRDFLVQIREYSGADDSDLFLAEREAALKQHEQEKRKRQLMVPGIINPYDLPQDMDEVD